MNPHFLLGYFNAGALTALLNAIDSAAHHQHKSRSALIAEAAQRLLGEI